MNIKYPSSKTLTIEVGGFQNGIDTETSENIGQIDFAVNGYNFDGKSGALTESIGFEKLTIPSSAEDNASEREPIRARTAPFVKLGVYKQFDFTENRRTDKLIAITDDYKVEFCRLVTAYPALMNLDEQQFSEIPNLLNYNDGTYDIILFSNETDGLFSWDDMIATKKWTNLPVVTNICVHKGRTFITQGGERLVIRTEPYNLIEWTEEESDENINITLDTERGAINKLLTMNDYIVAIRDYGITCISWIEAKEGLFTYDLKNLLFSAGRLYGKTAQICGNVGIVLCKDGLYKFDSTSAEKLDIKINSMLYGVSNKNAVGAFHNGVYYLACRLNFNDGQKIGCENSEYINNAIIIYDVFSGKWSISRGVDVIDLCAVQHESVDKLLACFNGEYGTSIGQLVKNGKFFDEVPTKFWRSPLSDLGYSDKEKYIREISLMSKHDCTVTVFTENEQRTFEVKSSQVLNRFSVRLKGKLVGVSIKSEHEKASISNIKLVVDVMDIDYV